MSHYVVGVITKNGDLPEIDDLLAPFDEGLEVVHHISRDELIAKEKGYVQSIKETTYAEYLKDPEKYKEESRNEYHVAFLEDTFPKMLEWTDEEYYQEAIRPYAEEDMVAADGSAISHYNPNSKWDWYVIGGRWKNALPTKAGDKVNSCLIKDIDMSPDPEAAEKAAHFWDVVVDQTVEDSTVFNFYKPEYYTKLYGTKEAYVDYMARFSLHSLLLPNGEWLEKGEMGWFGMDSSTAESIKAYTKQFDAALEKYKDHHLTIVDCHI